MEVLLDSNFIISCLRKKIDFFDILEGQGYKIILPREVLQEMKDLRIKVSSQDRAAIDTAFMLFEQKKVKKLSLGKMSVDEGLIAKGKQGAFIATLDAAIRRSVPNRIIISSAQLGLTSERT